MNLKIRKPWVRDILSVAIALIISLIFAFVLTLLLSDTPLESFKILLTGPGTKINRIGDWIEEVITLIFMGLSVSVLFKAKIFSMLPPANMIIASLVGGLVLLYSPFPPAVTIPLGMLAGGAAGALLSLLPAWINIKYQADLVVSTLMINMIVMRVNYFVILEYLRVVEINIIGSREFDSSNKLLSVPSAFSSNLGEIFEKLNKTTSISVMLYLAIGLSILLYFIVFHTKFGYKLRMVGENRDFANYGGVDDKKVSIETMMLSGFLAGLGGIHQTFVMHNRILGDPTSNFGYTGFLVSTMAQNNPILIPISALFYGFLRVGGDIMERTSDLSREMVMLLQGVIILMVSAKGILKTVTRRETTDEESKNVEKDSKKQKILTRLFGKGGK